MQNQKKPKLSLSKSVIAKLTSEEQSNILGGLAEAFTTSYVSCTGWACCETQTADQSSSPANDCDPCVSNPQ